MLKPLPIDWSAADVSLLVLSTHFHCAFNRGSERLAHMLDSLVRVSRRVE